MNVMSGRGDAGKAQKGRCRRASSGAGSAATTDQIAAALREFAEAGADEAILVVRPITEASIRALGEALALLDV